MAAETPLDRIHIRDLVLHCIVGVHHHERNTPRPIRLNLTLYADLLKRRWMINIGAAPSW